MHRGRCGIAQLRICMPAPATAAGLQVRADQVQQVGQRRRLGQIVGRAGLVGHRVQPRGLERREEHDGNRRELDVGAHHLADVDAVHARHEDVEQHQPRLQLADQRQRLAAVLRLQHVVAEAAERLGEEVEDRRVVVGHEHGRLARCSGTRGEPRAPAPSACGRISSPTSMKRRPTNRPSGPSRVSSARSLHHRAVVERELDLHQLARRHVRGRLEQQPGLREVARDRLGVGAGRRNRTLSAQPSRGVRRPTAGRSGLVVSPRNRRTFSTSSSLNRTQTPPRNRGPGACAGRRRRRSRRARRPRPAARPARALPAAAALRSR